MSRGICRLVCWAAAAGIGLVLGYLAGAIAGLGFFVGVVIALMGFLGFAWALPAMICPGDWDQRVERPVAPSAAPVATAAPESAPAPAAPPPASTPSAAPAEGGHWSASVSAESGAVGSGRGQTGLAASAALTEEATLRDGVGAWRYEGDAPAEATGDSDGSDGVRPEALTSPRDGGADDLKKIKGVGPKLEQLLNGLGFYHFDQVANWTAEEVAWVDANLEGFKGRVSRDDWVAQAKLLAEGGETEFSKKVDDGDVY